MNNIILSGNVTVKTTGTNVCKLLLAVDREYSEGTDYLYITCFGQTANYCTQYINKGDGIVIKGRVQNANYERDGKTVYKDSIIADRVERYRKKERDDNDA